MNVTELRERERDIDDQIIEMLQKWLYSTMTTFMHWSIYNVPSFVVAMYGITSMAHTNTAIGRLHKTTL